MQLFKNKNIKILAGEIVNFTISLRIIRKLIMILRLPVTFNKNINNEIVRPMEIRQ